MVFCESGRKIVWEREREREWIEKVELKEFLEVVEKYVKKDKKRKKKIEARIYLQLI